MNSRAENNFKQCELFWYGFIQRGLLFVEIEKENVKKYNHCDDCD